MRLYVCKIKKNLQGKKRDGDGTKIHRDKTSNRQMNGESIKEWEKYNGMEQSQIFFMESCQKKWKKQKKHSTDF